MKWVGLLLLIVIPVLLFGQDKKKQPSTFSALREDSLVLYDFNKRTDPLASIVDKNNNALTTFEKSVTLDSKTAAQLNQQIDSPKSYGANVADCFEPHLGIVYYKHGIIVAYINICMDCNRLEASMKLTAQDQQPQLAETGEVYYIGHGMSKSFRKNLNDLLRKYNFSHQNKSMPFNH